MIEFAAIVIMLSVVSAKSITFNVHYPETKVNPRVKFIVGYGPIDSPTGNLLNTKLPVDRTAILTSKDTWSVVSGDVSEGNLQITIYAIDENILKWDQSENLEYGPGGKERRIDCLLNHDTHGAIFVSWGNHNTTITPDTITVELYPYFCGHGYEFVTVPNVGGMGFAERDIVIGIPDSLRENPIQRDVSVAFMLDMSPMVTELISIPIGKEEVVLVGVRTVNRAYELIPFTDIPSDFDKIEICNGKQCYNSTNHGGGMILAPFLRGPVESAMLAIVGGGVSKINKRILWGFSLSGLTTFYIATRQSEYFDSYVVGSPSLWLNWDSTFTYYRPDNSFPMDKKLLVYNCMPGDDDVQMAITTNLVIDYFRKNWGFSDGDNFRYGQVWPTIHALHCVQKAINEFYAWI